MSTRKLIIYAGVILLSLTTVFAIVANTGDFRAQVALEEPCIAETDVNGDGIVNNEDCSGGGSGGGSSCVEPVDLSETTSSTNVAISPVPADCEPPVCLEGTPPSDVPGSVRASRDRADATAEGARSEVEAVKIATKTDIEAGQISSTIKTATEKVYDNKDQAKKELQKVWETSVVPRLKVEYYEAGWTKVQARTATSGNDAKSFFNTRYSKDPDRWGPQVTGEYTFLRNGNADLTGNVTIGGFTYNGQPLGSGFANISLTGTWNILGERLQGVASYDCEIGNASGATSVNGRWTNIGFRAQIPAWIKSGDKAVRLTFQFGVNLVEKKVVFPFGLAWNF